VQPSSLWILQGRDHSGQQRQRRDNPRAEAHRGAVKADAELILADDAQPGKWEMLLPSGRAVRPVAAVLKLAQLGPAEGDLVAHFIDTKASAAERD